MSTQPSLFSDTEVATVACSYAILGYIAMGDWLGVCGAVYGYTFGMILYRQLIAATEAAETLELAAPARPDSLAA